MSDPFFDTNILIDFMKGEPQSKAGTRVTGLFASVKPIKDPIAFLRRNTWPRILHAPLDKTRSLVCDLDVYRAICGSNGQGVIQQIAEYLLQQESISIDVYVFGPFIDGYVEGLIFNVCGNFACPIPDLACELDICEA